MNLAGTHLTPERIAVYPLLHVQLALPEAEWEKGGHAEQEVAAEAEYVPGSHVMQGDEPAVSLYVPGVHAAHVLLPSKNPATHEQLI